MTHAHDEAESLKNESEEHATQEEKLLQDSLIPVGIFRKS
jgi:hypothetical protein